MKKQAKKQPREYQSVWLTFSDGSKAGFTGQAVCWPGDVRLITKIHFTPPKKLPAGYSLEIIPNEG